MTKKEVIAISIKTLGKIQEFNGQEIIPITESTIPIGGIPGFDSMNGVEFSAMMDEAISIGEVGNICVSKDGIHVLTVSQIAERILEILDK